MRKVLNKIQRLSIRANATHPYNGLSSGQLQLMLYFKDDLDGNGELFKVIGIHLKDNIWIIIITY